MCLTILAKRDECQNTKGIDPMRTVLTLYSNNSSSPYNQSIHPTVLIETIKEKRGSEKKTQIVWTKNPKSFPLWLFLISVALFLISLISLHHCLCSFFGSRPSWFRPKFIYRREKKRDIRSSLSSCHRLPSLFLTHFVLQKLAFLERGARGLKSVLHAPCPIPCLCSPFSLPLHVGCSVDL